MYSWKDKIADKLSHLLSGSPSLKSPTFHQTQARPYSTDDYDGECEAETPNLHGEDGKYFSLRFTKYDNISNSREEYEDLGSARSNFGSEMFVDAIDRPNLEKSMPNLTDDSLFISYDLYEFFESALPNIVKGCQWVMLYRYIDFIYFLYIDFIILDFDIFCLCVKMKGSTRKHGISLRTLIRKSADLPGPCLLITGDKKGAVFGGLLDCPLKPTAKRKYQGTNQSFVFTTIYGEPRLFRPTGANRYFYMCLNDLLALGGGGNFALSMDGDLLTGSSGASETFGNLCLAHNQEFELKNVELWGFTHASQYLR